MTETVKTRSFHGSVLPLVAAIAAISFDSHAQQQEASAQALEEVIVFSRYREESLQEVPDTIVALDALEIEQKGITNLMDLTRSIPNMDFETVLHLGSVFINMRGINTMRGSEPGVSVYIDGIQATTPLQLSQELFDIESIEVLKGPQGALYGRSAIAGAINVVTKKPGEEVENVVRLGVANEGEWSASFKSSGPISPGTLYYSVFAGTMEWDGDIDNTFLNQPVNFRENENFRARLVWRPTDRLEIDMFGNYDDLYGGTYHFSTIVDKAGRAIFKNAADSYDYPIQAESLTTGDRTFEELALNVTYEPSFGGTIKYSFAIQDLEEHYGMPGTAAGGNIDPRYGTGNYDMTPFYVIHNSQSFWREGMLNELRYISDADKSVRFVVGAQYVNQELDDVLPIWFGGQYFAGIIPGNVANNLPLTTGLSTDANLDAFYFEAGYTRREIDALGLYAQLSWDVTPSTELTLAYRYDRDERDKLDKATQAYDDTTFTGSMPKISISHDLSESSMVYATISKGWRSGGFNKLKAAGDPTDFSIEYKEEELWSYEIGYKSTFNDGKGKLNAAVFYQDVENHQAFAFQPSLGGQVVFNIPEGEISGLEVDLSHSFDSGWDLGLSAGFLDSEITQFDGLAVGFGRPMNAASGEPVEGAKFPNVDHRQINIYAQHSAETDFGSLISRVDYVVNDDKQWFIVDGQNEEGARDFLNASFMLTRDNLELMLWAENLFDQESWASYEPVSLHGLPQDIANLNMQRRFGLRATFRF